MLDALGLNAPAPSRIGCAGQGLCLPWGFARHFVVTLPLWVSLGRWWSDARSRRCSWAFPFGRDGVVLSHAPKSLLWGG